MSDPAVALYVPGDRPERFAKAVATGADVILDLEDSVAPAHKPAARAAVASWLATTSTRPSVTGGPGSSGDRDGVQVRVNAPGTAELAADLAALPPDVALRVPKVEHATQLAGLGDRVVHVLLESALGLEHAFQIASAPGVVGLGLGEADLAAELGVADESGLSWARQRVVVAAAAAGLPAPLMSAYAAIADLDGLAVSCRLGRSLGFWGRTAVHPRQVPVIRAAFTATDAELAWAAEVLDALAATGVATLADGSMVDAAMARRARRLLGSARSRAE